VVNDPRKIGRRLPYWGCMNMKLTPFLAMHGHFGGGGMLLLLLFVFLAAVLLIASWSDKPQAK
jgi:hypothetical protein